MTASPFHFGPAAGQAVQALLQAPVAERRISVGFIGASPLGLLGGKGVVKGTTIYCRPKGGATCPGGIGQLEAAGATVHLVPELHAKVYWTPKGALVGSSNLSGNGLGSDGLVEALVEVSSDAVPQAFWDHLDARRLKLSPAELDALMEKLWADWGKKQGEDGSDRTPPKAPSMEEWGAATHRAPFWVTFFFGKAVLTQEGKARLAEEGESPKPYDMFTWENPKISLPENSWLLYFHKVGREPLTVEWMFCDRVIKMPRSGAEDAYWLVIQRKVRRDYPFDLKPYRKRMLAEMSALSSREMKEFSAEGFKKVRSLAQFGIKI